MKKITPNIDLQNSIQRDRILESRDFYKGKSFNYSEWTSGRKYFNNDYIIDFVSYNGALYACKYDHFSTNPPSQEDSNWTFVMAGTPGKNGQVYVPKYDDKTGLLSWELKDDIGNINNIDITPKVGFAESFEKLERDFPASDYPGRIFIVEDGEDDIEYISVRRGDAGQTYQWEQIGVTKKEVQKIQEDTNANIEIITSQLTEKIADVQRDIEDNYISKNELLSDSVSIDGGEIRWQ